MGILLDLKDGYRLVFPVLLCILLYGCLELKPQTADNKVFPGILEVAEVDEYMRSALVSYSLGNYPEARKDFFQARQITEDRDIIRQAELGIILSRLLSAESMAEFIRYHRDLDQIIDQHTEKLFLDFRITIPFVSKKADYIELKNMLKALDARHRETLDSLRRTKDEKDVLKAENTAHAQKLHAMEEENFSLKNQIQELEELFDLIEQQKRPLFE